MAKEMEAKGITTRAEDYAQWYLDVIDAAGLAEHSPVKGCMIIKPYGYAIWELIQKDLDARFKKEGVQNAYFPLLIPMSFLSREAEHVEGFAKECAVVTHHRLEKGEDGNLHPAPSAELEEPYVIRPTSETIIGEAMSRWVQSYRDLPLLLNQWCNVMRWELRTRLFLRTSEFLWQEGHTAHATADDADSFARRMFDVYRVFAEEVLAIPVIPGRKSDSERFAGAVTTYTIEGMMQDGKALQCGTSHFLGQNFAKAMQIKFTDEENKEQYVWQTSWGVSTRLIGGLILTHSDDKGLVLPPSVAPIQVVIIPILGKEGGENVKAAVDELAETLTQAGLRVKVDSRDMRPGEKYFEWEKKGVPVRIELGPKDLAAGTAVLVRRDTGEKLSAELANIGEQVPDFLNEIQKAIFDRARGTRDRNTVNVENWKEFVEAIEAGKFVRAHWSGEAEVEAKIKEETGATIRCIPNDSPLEKGVCVLSGKPSERRVLFARAY